MRGNEAFYIEGGAEELPTTKIAGRSFYIEGTKGRAESGSRLRLRPGRCYATRPVRRLRRPEASTGRNGDDAVGVTQLV